MERKTEWKDLSKIIVPAKDMRFLYPDKPDYLIEVTPRDDKWLAGNDRSYEEVDKTLEGRLKGIEENLLEDNPNSYKLTYGSESQMSLPQVRFLAYVDLYAKNQIGQNINEKRIS